MLQIVAEYCVLPVLILYQGKEKTEIVYYYQLAETPTKHNHIVDVFELQKVFVLNRLSY